MDTARFGATRIGILEGSGEANFSLKVNKNSWEVERFGLNQNFEDIESLIEWIRSVDWRE